MTSQPPVASKEKPASHAALRLAILCMAFYAVSYIARKSFDSNINEIMDYFGRTKSTVGLIGTFFFIAYAVGQVVHGVMCKYYRPVPTIFAMGMVSACMNLLMGIIPKEGFAYLKLVWLVNGFACASFWSVLILTLNRSVAQKHKGMVLFVTCFPVTTGTFLSYGLSALLSYLRQFRYSFLIACGVMMVMCVVWLLRARPLIGACLEERRLCDGEEADADPGKKQGNGGWTRSFVILFAFLAVFAISTNLIRDGVNTWTPSILKETYHMENWVSVLLSVAVPLMGVFGGLISIRLYRKLNSDMAANGVLFLASGVILTVLLLCFKLNVWIVTLLCLMGTSLTMAAVNNILTAIFPLNCENVNAGTVAGVIDGFCYVGSAVSSYCIGAISEKTGGWNAVFVLFAAISFLCVLVAVVYTLAHRSSANRKA